MPEIFIAPHREEVQDAIPVSRRPYVAAQSMIDYVMASTIAPHPQDAEFLPLEIGAVFADLHEGIRQESLEPPIDPDSALGGIVADFDTFYRQRKELKLETKHKDNMTALQALYAVVDHGGHRQNTQANRFDEEAHERAHRKPRMVEFSRNEQRRLERNVRRKAGQ